MISVIVPVYNVEVYLPRCLDSILAQTYSDYELLLVDDGSTDASGAICDQYALRDARIHVFHKPNAGLSDARNHGLNRMRGEYVTFIDSDDYVGPDYLKILVEMIEDNDADIASLSMEDTWSEGMIFTDSTDDRWVYSREETFRKMLIGRSIGVMSCGKLYHVGLFEGNRFPLGQTYEDLATIPSVIARCRKSVVSSAREYYYYQRADSLSNRITPKVADVWIGTMEKLLALTQRQFPQLYPYAEARLVKTTFWWILDRLLLSDGYMDAARRFKSTWGDHFRKVWQLPCLTIKERFKVTSFMINVRLFRAIRLPMLRVKALLRDKKG